MERIEPSGEEEQKESRWENKRSELLQVTDRLSEPIEPGIIDTVIGLNLLAFHTEQSCEGHADRAIPAPWVMLSVPGQPAERYVNETAIAEAVAREYGLSVGELHEGINESANQQLDQQLTRSGERPEFQTWQASLRRESGKLSALLEEFYRDREVATANRLIIEEGADYFRLHNGGEDFRKGSFDELTDADRRGLGERLIAYQSEMQFFTDFLKQKL